MTNVLSAILVPHGYDLSSFLTHHARDRTPLVLILRRRNLSLWFLCSWWSASLSATLGGISPSRRPPHGSSLTRDASPRRRRLQDVTSTAPTTWCSFLDGISGSRCRRRGGGHLPRLDSMAHLLPPSST
jgi:hypothetical protein